MCSLEWNQEDKIKDEVIRVAALHQDSTLANGWLQCGTGCFDPLGLNMALFLWMVFAFPLDLDSSPVGSYNYSY